MSMLQLCVVCCQVVPVVNRNQFSMRQFGGIELSIVKIFTDHLAISFTFVVYILLFFFYVLFFCFNYRFIISQRNSKCICLNLFAPQIVDSSMLPVYDCTK